jgi:general secretion pathway protein G
MRGFHRQTRRAFSLIELVIVIIILGVISAIAIPRMISGADNADVTAMQADLAVLRSAMEMCRYEHAGFPADAVEFVDWMTTTVSGKGPYIIKIPPLKTGAQSGETAVKIITNDPPLLGDVSAGFGWLYNATTGGIFANDVDHLDK